MVNGRFIGRQNASLAETLELPQAGRYDIQLSTTMATTTEKRQCANAAIGCARNGLIVRDRHSLIDGDAFWRFGVRA